MTHSLRAIYRFWAMLLFPAVIVQVGAAGYGAFNAAHKVSDTTPLTQKQWDHGFGFHMAFGYILFLASVLLFLFALAARLGRKRECGGMVPRRVRGDTAGSVRLRQ